MQNQSIEMRITFDTQVKTTLNVISKAWFVTEWNDNLENDRFFHFWFSLQFHDGVYLIFLLGLLEGFFVPLYQFYITPSNKEQKVGNVQLCVWLISDKIMIKIQWLPRVKDTGVAGIAQWWKCSPPTSVAWVRFRSGAICGLSLLLVLAWLREFFSGFSGFPSSTKTNISKFQFNQDRGPAWKPARAEVASSLNIVHTDCWQPIFSTRVRLVFIRAQERKKGLKYLVS